jgi:hypothetical protein
MCVKTAHHIAFDESMNDLDIKPPNARLLDVIHCGQIDDIMADLDMNLPNLDVSLCPFHDIFTISIPWILILQHRLKWSLIPATDSFGPMSPSFSSSPLASSSGSFDMTILVLMLSLLMNLLCSASTTLPALSTVAAHPASAPPTTIRVELAKERQTEHNTHATPLHLCMHNLQCICALQSVAGEGMTYDEYHAAVNRHNTDGMTPEEQHFEKILLVLI